MMIAKTFGVSDQNDFALLERIGGECAGAVSLMPKGMAPSRDLRNYREISLTELAHQLSELPQRPLLAGQEGMRLSLAGAQSKLAVAIFDGKIFMPLHGAPSTHIIKPQGNHFEGLVENEFFCMRLAAMAGLDVASVEIGTAESVRFLQVLRYDRHLKQDGTLERTHQEDFCQALGIAPEWKYQQEGGPGLKKCFDLVRTVSSLSAVDLQRLFDAVVFNYLIGNNDAHGKNFSLLRDADQVRLAPLYDLVCTQAYPALAAEMAMKIGGERNPLLVIGKNWLKFFAEAGFSTAVAAKHMQSFAHKVEEIIRAMDESQSGWSMVAPQVLTHCALLRTL